MANETDSHSTGQAMDSVTIAKYLGMHGDGLIKQQESATLFAELKRARAITGLDQKTIARETHSSEGTRAAMRELHRARRTPLDLDTLK